MTEQSPAAVAGTAQAPAARLEPNAIGVAQDVVIGMASSAPAATIGLSLALLASATAYASGLILIITAVPMLIIANAYRRRTLLAGLVACQHRRDQRTARAGLASQVVHSGR